MSDGVKKINENIMKNGRTITITKMMDANKFEPGTQFIDPTTGLLNYIHVDNTSKKSWVKYNPNVIFEHGSILSGLIGKNQILTEAILDGNITTSKIKPGDIKTICLDDGSVTKSKIAINSVDTPRICNLSITNEKIVSGTIDWDKLHSDSVREDAIKNFSVTNNKIANSSIIAYDKIYPKTITIGQIKDKTLDEALFHDKCISSRLLMDRCINNNNIKLGCINGSLITENCITTNHIALNTITTSNINYIHGKKIVDGTLTEAKFGNGQVSNRIICSEAISYEKLDTNLKDLTNRAIRVDANKTIDNASYVKTAWVNGSLVVKTGGSDNASLFKVYGKAVIVGDLQATRVYNAVFSDLAEAYIPTEKLEEGDPVSLSLEGKLKIEKLNEFNADRFLGFISNSYATVYGATPEELRDKKKVPVCLVGRIKIKSMQRAELGNYVYIDNGMVKFSKKRTVNSIGRTLENKSLNDNYVLCQLWP